jgi:8-oxo-dGTP pyrophosphatase MutT (NUDIX family)
VLPVLPSGQIILVLNFRHPTRSWKLELPRGGMQSGETQEEAALRELKEETGFITSSYAVEVIFNPNCESIFRNSFLKTPRAPYKEPMDDCRSMRMIFLSRLFLHLLTYLLRSERQS